MTRMRRPLLTSIAALGGVITLAGTTGVFAVFNDRATTGSNSVGTASLPRAADLKIASGTLTALDGQPWTVACGTYVDDLETGTITLADAVPGGGFGGDFMCLKNSGSQTVDVTTSAIDVSDLDTGCTGDESGVDDTCGSDETTGLSQAGELGSLVGISMITASCSDANQGGAGLGAVNAIAKRTVGSLTPGQVICVRFDASYNPTESQAQIAQSDTVTWRFAFDGAVSTT
jgi:hypothetical protein